MNRRMAAMRAHRWPAFLLALAVLSGCGDDAARGRQTANADADAALPAPAGAGAAGSITGMPDAPGPGEVPLAGGAPPAPPPETLPVDPFAVGPLEDNPETGFAAATPAGGDAASPAEAAATVSRYYAAIRAGDYGRAYALWSDGGRASGQSPEQFAAGFAPFASSEAQVGAPQGLQAAGDAVLVEVPVSVTAVQHDGAVRRFSGRYILRRAVDADAGAWRITAAELQEVRL